MTSHCPYLIYFNLLFYTYYIYVSVQIGPMLYTHFVVHMEAADSREVERHSPHMGKLLKERGLSSGLVDG